MCEASPIPMQRSIVNFFGYIIHQNLLSDLQNGLISKHSITVLEQVNALQNLVASLALSYLISAAM